MARNAPLQMQKLMLAGKNCTREVFLTSPEFAGEEELGQPRILFWHPAHATNSVSQMLNEQTFHEDDALFF